MRQMLYMLTGMAIGAALSCLIMGMRHGMRPGIDAERVTVYDTVTYRRPVAVDSAVVRYVTVKVSPEAPGDTLAPRISAVGDSVTIPMQSKVYADSAYRVSISGYMARLDSIEIYRPTVYVTAKARPRRWNIGISAGAAITPKGPQPYIGVGVTYNLLR